MTNYSTSTFNYITTVFFYTPILPILPTNASTPKFSPQEYFHFYGRYFSFRR